MLTRTMPDKALQFHLHIGRDEYLKYYAGRASVVRTTTLNGISIEFPAINLMPWVTHAGISGTFEIRFDDNNKLKGIQKIAD